MKAWNRESLMFDHCWVCEQRFKNSTPPGPANREDHHICPQNAGGADGPLVSLCDSHHTCIHKIANRLHRKAQFGDLLSGEPKVQAQKLAWLAAMIVRSEQSVQDDPNKKFHNGVSFSRQEIAMLERLQSATGKGRAEIIRASLHLFHAKFFGQTK